MAAPCSRPRPARSVASSASPAPTPSGSSAICADAPPAWVVTDGKAGDEEPCLGLVEAMGLAALPFRVRPRRPWSWLAPRGPGDPREAPGRTDGPFHPPWPDLLVGSGRRAIPAIRAIKRASGGRTFTVILKDPRVGAGAADLVWVPETDRLRGPNVVATATGPHRLSPAVLREAGEAPDPRLDALPEPRVAVLVGGRSRHLRFGDEDVLRLVAGLTRLAASGASLMITTSRRTPPALADALADLARGRAAAFLWDGTGANPYPGMLARAAATVATADSVNMVGEAAATGRPVLVFEPAGVPARHRAFLEALTRYGAVRPFRGQLEAFRYQPLDATAQIARAVAAAMARHRATLS